MITIHTIWERLGLKLIIDKNRIFGLDILRAFAISVVVVTHSVTYLPDAWTNFISKIALDGVSIFFVLSGYLIGRILIRTMSGAGTNFLTLTDFWMRRWLRTLPIYFLVFSTVLIIYNYPTFNAAPTFKRYYVFLQNFYTPHPGFFIEAWSLSVEEWFYILIPLSVFVAVKYFNRNIYSSILFISAVVIVFSTLVRLERYSMYYPIDVRKFALYFRMQVVTQLDSLMFGVLGALFSVFNYEKWMVKKELKFTLGVAVLICNKVLYNMDQSFLTLYNAVFFLSLNAIGTLLTIPMLSSIKTGRGRLFKAITYVSLISYSLYLINLTPVQQFFMPFFNRYVLKNTWNVKLIDLLIYFPVIIFGSIYLYKFVEQPFLRLRNKIRLNVKNSKVIADEH